MIWAITHEFFLCFVFVLRWPITYYISISKIEYMLLASPEIIYYSIQYPMLSNYALQLQKYVPKLPNLYSIFCAMLS